MSQQLTIREETGKFFDTIKSPAYQQKFKEMLPGDVPVSRFTNVVLRAVQENPDLMKPSTDKASLFLACQRAAQDGLIPDGREGALVMYGTKVQWQVMIGGLRKALARAGFDLRTQTVKENDEFDYQLGDDPHITHKTPKLGQPRGKTIGVYAIARGPDGRIYRDVMDMEAIQYVKSKAKSGNVWNTWFDAMAEKTVGRRLVKSLPLYTEDDKLREMIEQDNEHFDLGQPQASDTAKRVQEAARTAAAAQRTDPDAEVIEGTATVVEPEPPATEDAPQPPDDIPF